MCDPCLAAQLQYFVRDLDMGVIMAPSIRNYNLERKRKEKEKKGFKEDIAFLYAFVCPQRCCEEADV